MKTNDIRRKETLHIGNFIVTISASLNDECKNGHEDFGLTYDMWENKVSSRTWCAGGCAAGNDDPIVSKAIEKLGLTNVEKCHLSDMNGVPMYPTGNAIYHAKNSGFEVFRDYLRLTDEEAQRAIYIDDEFALFVWLLDNGIIDRWKNEANEAIKEIINGRDIEFESTATKPQGHWYFKHEVTEDAIKAQRNLILSEYYDRDHYDQRRQANDLAECLKKIDSSISTSQKRINKEELKININQAIHDILEEHIAEFKKPIVLVENHIFYDHKNELTFNWREFGENVDADDYELLKNYLEDFCDEYGIECNIKKPH